VGTDSITAGYGATTNFGAATSSAISQVVNLADSTTASVASSLSPAGIGQSVTPYRNGLQRLRGANRFGDL
jgi:hypothetical protein